MPSRKQAAPAQSDKLLSRRVLVNIKRDQTTATPRVVWAHEVPILEAIWGDGNVEAVEPETLDEGFTGKAAPSMLVHNKQQDGFRRPSESLCLGWAFVGNIEAEYERLGACYGMHPEVKQSWVENVYGRLRNGAFAKAVGMAELEDLPEDQLRSLLVQAGYMLPVVTYESSEAEKAEATKARRAFESADKPSLIKLAEDFGVEIG